MTTDPTVSHPSHYREGREYECFDVLMDWFSTDPLLWNAVKYLSRCGRKGGPEDAVRDVEKAIWYLERKLQQLRGERPRAL